jgi:hypothetical protein
MGQLRREPREKDRLRVPVSEELRRLLKEVNFLINESKRNADVRVDYDDAIQLENLIGGRVGTKKRPFEFTYYPEGKGKKSRWRLALHPLEIEDIADGCMTELTLYCCRTPGCGHQSTDREDLCDCDYVEDLYSGNVKFPEATEALRRIGVSGVTPESTREEVIGLLGEPTFSGGGQKDPTFGFIWPWIKYHRFDCQLRFEFGKGGGIRLVSILEPDWEPGK